MPRPSPPNELATREAFFQREQKAWRTLTRTWSGLPEAAFLQPGASGPEWSIKDVMHHLAAWQESALTAIEELQGGRWARLGASTDSFNQQHYLQDRDRPLGEGQKRLRSTRSRLLRKLRTVSNPELLNEYGRQAIGWWAKWTTYAHYEEHIQNLRAFRVRWIGAQND